MAKAAAAQPLSDFLTVADAAAVVGVSPDTLRRWDRAGKLTAVRHPINGYRLYHREDLEALLKTVRQTKPSANPVKGQPARGPSMNQTPIE